jgi:cytochrome P450
VAITGFDEALEVYSDSVNFSSINAVTGPIPGLPFVPFGDDISEQIEAHRDEMPFAREVVAIDPPEHDRLRSLLMPLFTPSKLKRLEPRFRATARSLIDKFKTCGSVEFIGGYANPLATLIITGVLGIPDDQQESFLEFFQGGPAGEIGKEGRSAADNPLIEMGYRIGALIAARREQPCDDLLTEFALAKYSDGSAPTLDEATRAACFLFGAGQDTTTKLLGSSFRQLAERPTFQAILRDNPDRIGDFIEEVLRYEGSIKSSHRLCRRSVEVGGVAIPAGTTVLIANLAVNRDPARFFDPNEFEIDRPKRKEHLAFGRGPHTCAGAPLARAEVRISIECLLAEVEDIRLCEARHGAEGARRFRHEPSYVLRGLEELHLEFTSRR